MQGVQFLQTFLFAVNVDLQLCRALRALVERHDAGEYARPKGPPVESPFGRSQTHGGECAPARHLSGQVRCSELLATAGLIIRI